MENRPQTRTVQRKVGADISMHDKKRIRVVSQDEITVVVTDVGSRT